VVFEFFMPHRIWYDNLKAAAEEILEGHRAVSN